MLLAYNSGCSRHIIKKRQADDKWSSYIIGEPTPSEETPSEEKEKPKPSKEENLLKDGMPETVFEIKEDNHKARMAKEIVDAELRLQENGSSAAFREESDCGLKRGQFALEALELPVTRIST